MSEVSRLHSHSVRAQVVRFAVVGLANTGVYYGSYLLFRQALTFLAADLLAVLVAMVVAFFGHSLFTYRTRPTWRKFLLFPLGNIVGYLVLTVGAWLLVQAGMNDRWAPLAAACVSIPLTFLTLRLIMLGRRPLQRHRVNRPSRKRATW